MTTLSQDLVRVGLAMANHKPAAEYKAGDLIVPIEGVGNERIKLAVVIGVVKPLTELGGGSSAPSMTRDRTRALNQAGYGDYLTVAYYPIGNNGSHLAYMGTVQTEDVHVSSIRPASVEEIHRVDKLVAVGLAKIIMERSLTSNGLEERLMVDKATASGKSASDYFEMAFATTDTTTTIGRIKERAVGFGERLADALQKDAMHVANVKMTVADELLDKARETAEAPAPAERPTSPLTMRERIQISRRMLKYINRVMELGCQPYPLKDATDWKFRLDANPSEMSHGATAIMAMTFRNGSPSGTITTFCGEPAVQIVPIPGNPDVSGIIVVMMDNDGEITTIDLR